MSVITKLKQEPVRAYIYSVLVIGVGVLVALGVINDSVENYIEALGAIVLAVPAVESARSAVKPVVPSAPPTE